MKKKIIIFTSSGGGGHISAAHALTAYLGSTYDIVVLDMYAEVMKFYLIPGKYSCNDVYNYLLKNGWILTLNMLEHVCRGVFAIINPLSIWRIKQAIAPHKPDCLISIVPLSNRPTLDVAQELNIPFFLIPVDFDPRTFLFGIKNPTYEKFYIAQVVEDPEVHRRIRNTGIKENQIIHTGFIVRPDFLKPKDSAAIKKTLHIKEDIPVIMIMLGSVASENTYNIARALTQITKTCHILFCTGKNITLAEKIRTVIFPAHISTHILEFTENIADLMAITDIFVTKSGSNSVAEALQINLPVIVARFGKSLRWEQFNLHYLTAHKIGMVADGVENIKKMIIQLLDNPEQLQSMKNALKARKKVDIDKNINEALRRILSK